MGDQQIVDCSRSRQKRYGLTLIELLVVLAIIAVLLGLLLPAVQKTREAAARVKCGNNLRNLIIACHNYESSRGRFPSAGTPEYQGEPGPESGWAWQIAPYVEQAAVLKLGWKEAAAAGLGPLAHCPSKPGPRVWPQWDQGWPAAMLDYTGGTYSLEQEYPVGFFKVGPKGHAANAPRGLSNLLAISEKCLTQRDRNWDDDFGPFGGAINDSMGNVFQPPSRDFPGPSGDAIWPAGYSSTYGQGRFGSSHPGGLNVAYGDGSVRFVSYAIDPSLWWQTGSRE